MTTTGGTLKLQEGTGNGDAVGFKAKYRSYRWGFSAKLA
jgi:hypothetical protein